MNEGHKSYIPSELIAPSDSAYNFFKNIGAVPHKDVAVGELDTRFLNKNML